MVNQEHVIISPRERHRQYYNIVKDNTAQIAIALPIFGAVFAIIRNYYFYIISCGYYTYFGINDEFMLPYSKSNIYQNIGQVVLVGMYWGYTIFATRMWKLKRNWFWKIIVSTIIPAAINIVILYDGCISFTEIIVSIIMIPVHWIMVFSLGYCMSIPNRQETGEKTKKTRQKRVKRKWGAAEYRVLGMLIIFCGVSILFWQGYQESNKKASAQKTYGICIVEEREYAIIDANEEKVVLQRCKVLDDTLVIDPQTYLCINKDALRITFKTFEIVKINNV